MENIKLDNSIINLKNIKQIELENLKDLSSKVKNTKYGDVIWCENLPKDKQSIKYIKEIEDRIEKNNENFSRFPSDYMHSLFSFYVYKDLNEGQKLDEIPNWENKNMKELKNWKVHKVFNKPSEDNKDTKTKKGFFYSGALFINHRNNQMVLAHRGIDANWLHWFKDQSALDTNFNGILLNNTVPQMAICYEITEHVINNIANKKEYNDYYLSFTGYSNGAWLAEYSIYYAHKRLSYFETRAVLFESPGITKNESDLNSNIISEETEVDLRKLNIVNYLCTPNLLNSSNSHIGTVYRLFLDNKKENESKKFLEFLEKYLRPLKIFDSVIETLKKSKFLINGLMSMFNHDNLESIIKLFNTKTGKPEYYEHMLNWPIVKIDFGKNFEENFKNTFIDIPVEKIVDNIPLAKLLPDLLTDTAKSIFKTGCGLVLDNLTKFAVPGIHMLINFVIDILKGNMDLNVFENELFYKRLDEIVEIKTSADIIEYNYAPNEDEKKKEEKKEKFLKTFKNKISSFFSKDKEQKKMDAKQKNIDNKFSLINAYEPTRVFDKVKMLKPLADKQNIDWCLKNLYFNFGSIGKDKPSKIIFDQLHKLKSKYSIKTELFGNINCDTVHFVFIDDDELTVELLKDKLIRLIKLYPEIKNKIEGVNQPSEKSNNFLRNNFLLNKNFNFVKKLDFENIWHKFFVDKKKSILIHGIAGSGKSTSASEFGRFFVGENETEHFCLSFTLNNLENGTVNTIKETTDIINQPMNKTNKYLFIFDDVYFDDSFKSKYDELIKNFPSNIFILLTSDSSNPNLLKLFGLSIEIKLFDRNEAKQLFESSLQHKHGNTEAIMDKLKDKNEFIPLKLLNIIRFIDHHEEKTIDEAMDLINPEDFNSTEFYFPELLKDIDTKNILELLVFTKCKKLTTDFFKKVLGFENTKQIDDGILKLKNKSILYQSYDSCDGKYYLNMHDVLKEELLTFVKKDQKNLDRFLLNLSISLESNTVFTLNDINHIVNIAQNENKNSEELDAVYEKLNKIFKIKINQFLKDDKYNEAIQYLQMYELMNLNENKKTENKHEYELFYVYDNFEKAFTQLNNKEQADKYHQLLDDLTITRENYENDNGNHDSIDDRETLDFLEINKNEEKLDFAKSLFNLGCSYQNIEKYRDAIKLYENTIEIYLEIYGYKAHPFIDVVYKCIKECDVENTYVEDFKNNSKNPHNAKFLNYKKINESTACVLS